VPDVVVPYGLLIEVRDGLIARLELYESGDEALDESGLA
jgi:hypothetical protein